MAESNPPHDERNKDSDEFHEHQCTPCGLEDVTRRALFMCVDCDAYYCASCMKDHNRFPHLRSHQVLDESAMRSGVEAAECPAPVPTGRCGVHHSKVMDMFCVDHDKVCCAACIAIDHRSCKKVDYIPTISDGIFNSSDLKEAVEKSKCLPLTAQKTIDSKDENLKNLKSEEEKLITDLENKKAATITRVTELFEKSKVEVRKRHTEKSQVLRKARDDMNDRLDKLKENFKTINRTQGNRSQVFVDMKVGQELMKKVQGLIDADDIVAVGLELKVNGAVFDDMKEKNQILQVASCGKTITSIALLKKVTLKSSEDKQTCDVSDILQLRDGSYLVTDYSNKALKMFCSSFNLLSSVSFTCGPMSVCYLGENKVAVTLRNDKKVQIVDVGQTLKTVNDFSTPKTCTGICYDDNEDNLYVCLGGKWLDGNSFINVYTKQGVLKQTIEKDSSEISLFTSAVKVRMAGKNTLCVADREKGFMKIDTKGNILWTFTDKNIKDPWGCNVTAWGDVFVMGNKSDSVIQLTENGQMLGQISHSDMKGCSVLLSNDGKSLFIGGYSDDLCMYSTTTHNHNHNRPRYD